MISSLHTLTSLDLPELEPYRTLRRPIEHLQKGIFIAEGEKIVLRLLESTLTIRTLLISHEKFEIIRPLIQNNSHPIDVYVGKKELLDTIVGYDLHQAVMAVADVPRPKSINDIFTGLSDQSNKKANKRKISKIYVMVDGVTKSENMGVIVRNCACFDVDALFVLPTSCDPYMRRSVRNSMGNIFHMPIVYLQNTVEDIQKLQSHGIKMYGAHPHPESKNFLTTSYAERSCIIFGSEGPGISREVLDCCDEFITIPMKEGVDSLNVASASAVMLHHLTIAT